MTFDKLKRDAMHTRFHALASIATPLVLISLCQAQVQIVGGGTFSTLQAAVDAAPSGSTVLVRDGSHARPTISKSLRLVADGEFVRLGAGALIENLGPDDSVFLDGFRSLSAQDSITARNCAGSVWIENCTHFSAVGESLHVETCLDVVLLRCELESGQSLPFGTPTATVHASQSEVHLFDSQLEGHAGGLIPCACTLDGGPAIRAVDSVVVIQATDCIGSTGPSPSHGTPGDGGAGVEALGASQIFARDSSFVGGPGGNPFIGVGPSGADGLPVVLHDTATFTDLPGASHRLTAPSVAREGDAVDYVNEGPSGDFIVMTFNFSTGSIFFPFAGGTLLLGADFGSIPLGTIPSSGTLTLPTFLPDLGPGVNVRPFFVQSIAISPVDGVLVGSGQGLTLLDRAF